MAKQKPKPDHHKAKFFVRLPNRYKTALETLKKESRRTFTVEIQLALDAYLKIKGVTIPDE